MEYLPMRLNLNFHLPTTLLSGLQNVVSGNGSKYMMNESQQAERQKRVTPDRITF